MDDYGIISNHLRGNSSYYFELDGYWLPKFIGNSNLEKNRLQELKVESSYVKNLKRDIVRYKLLKSYIQEFPFPIEHIESWHRILKAVGLEEGSKYFGVNYFKLDFFFPSLSLCIEVDSSYHFSKSKYDQARDAYLSSIYGIRTVRLLNYGESEKNRKLNLSTLESVLGLSVSGPLVILNFTKHAVERYLEVEKEVFSGIVKIRDKVGEDRFIVDRKLDITQDQFSFSDDLWKRVTEVLVKVYKKIVV